MHSAEFDVTGSRVAARSALGGFMRVIGLLVHPSQEGVADESGAEVRTLLTGFREQ